MNTTNAVHKQFTASNPPNPGDKVMIGTHWRHPEGPYTVIAVEQDRHGGTYLSLEGRSHWYLHADAESSGCRLHEPAPAPVPATPTEPSKPMTKAVLDLLKSKGSLTSIEAQGVLRCRALAKRISELKDLGWKITSELKNDISGQRYARYHLQN